MPFILRDCCVRCALHIVLFDMQSGASAALIMVKIAIDRE